MKKNQATPEEIEKALGIEPEPETAAVTVDATPSLLNKILDRLNLLERRLEPVTPNPGAIPAASSVAPGSFSEMMSMFKNFGGVYQGVFKTIQEAQEIGMRQGITIGKMAAENNEALIRAENAEEELDVLIAELKDAKSDGAPIDRLAALTDKIVQVYANSKGPARE